jgi:hypothetical protein
MVYVSDAEFRRMQAIDRKSRRAQRVRDNAALAGIDPPATAQAAPRIVKKSFSRWKQLRDQCMELAKQLSRIRDSKDGGRCRICGVRDVQCGYHIIPVGKLAVAFDPLNVVGACHNCNNGERMDRSAYARSGGKHERIFGKPYMDALWAKVKSVKWSVPDLEEKREELRTLIKNVCS